MKKPIQYEWCETARRYVVPAEKPKPVAVEEKAKKPKKKPKPY